VREPVCPVPHDTAAPATRKLFTWLQITANNFFFSHNNKTTQESETVNSLPKLKRLAEMTGREIMPSLDGRGILKEDFINSSNDLIKSSTK